MSSSSLNTHTRALTQSTHHTHFTSTLPTQRATMLTHLPRDWWMDGWMDGSGRMTHTRHILCVCVSGEHRGLAQGWCHSNWHQDDWLYVMTR